MSAPYARALRDLAAYLDQPRTASERQGVADRLRHCAEGIAQLERTYEAIAPEAWKRECERLLATAGDQA